MKHTHLLVGVLASAALVGCGSTANSTPASKPDSSAVSINSAADPVASSVETPATAAKLVKSYIGTFVGGYYIPAYNMVQPGFDNYVVDLFDDNTYVSNKVIYMDMYGTQGSVVITTTGSYSIDENEDGDEIVSLSDAASILYTTCGMFQMQYSFNVDGIEDSVFPVALLGSSSNSDTLDFFKGEYGFGYSFLTSDSGCTITELYLPDSYAIHFAPKDDEGNLLPRTPSQVVNPYQGDIKAHDFGKEIDNVYIGTFVGGYYIPAYQMLQPGFDNYVVTTFDDGTYLALNVKYMDMYGTQGSVVLRTEGKFTVDENEDGDEIIALAAADSILYTTCGMFFMQYASGVNGIEDSLFPVALLGSSSNSDTLDFFKGEYGYAYSFLTSDSGCTVVELSLPEEIAAHFVVEEEPIGSEEEVEEQSAESEEAVE